jgi:hypothetical protein
VRPTGWIPELYWKYRAKCQKRESALSVFVNVGFLITLRRAGLFPGTISASMLYLPLLAFQNAGWIQPCPLSAWTATPAFVIGSTYPLQYLSVMVRALSQATWELIG